MALMRFHAVVLSNPVNTVHAEEASAEVSTRQADVLSVRALMAHAEEIGNVPDVRICQAVSFDIAATMAHEEDELLAA